MKPHVSALLLLLACLAGCGSERDARRQVVGIWARDSAPGVVQELTFNANGTFTMIIYEGSRLIRSATGTYEMDGASMQLVMPEETTLPSRVTVHEDTLTVADPGTPLADRPRFTRRRAP